MESRFRQPKRYMSPEATVEKADRLFSAAEIETLMEKNDYQCRACHIQDTLQPHLIIPKEHGGKMTLENATVLCGGCVIEVEKAAAAPQTERRRVDKKMKKQLWKTRGRGCEDCGIQMKTGGRTQAIHPFRPANWDGTVEGLRVLCSTCLGSAASTRDTILKLAIVRINNK